MTNVGVLSTEDDSMQDRGDRTIPARPERTNIRREEWIFEHGKLLDTKDNTEQARRQITTRGESEVESKSLDEHINEIGRPRLPLKHLSWREERQKELGNDQGQGSTGNFLKDCETLVAWISLDAFEFIKVGLLNRQESQM